MEQIYYWIGVCLIWLISISGLVGLSFLLLAYIVTRTKDNALFAQFLIDRKKFKEYLRLKRNLHKNPIDSKDISAYMANLEG